MLVDSKGPFDVLHDKLAWPEALLPWLEALLGLNPENTFYLLFAFDTSFHTAMVSLLTLLLIGAMMCQGGVADHGCLLQSRKSQPLKSCLTFIHIPKNAGGSIQLARLRSHGVETDNMCLTERDKWMHLKHPKGFLWGYCDPDLFSIHTTSVCRKQHLPPALYEPLRAYFTENCDSFCVVRHPLDRFISQYRFWRKGHGNNINNCSADDLEKFAQESFAANATAQDCHLYPQVFYVFEEGKPEKPPICRHVLKMSSIKVDFPKLMKQYGLETVTLPDEEVHNFGPDKCSKVVPNAKTIEMVKSFYHQDYAAFAFHWPTQRRWYSIALNCTQKGASAAAAGRSCAWVCMSGHAVESERTQSKKRLQNRCQKIGCTQPHCWTTQQWNCGWWNMNQSYYG